MIEEDVDGGEKYRCWWRRFEVKHQALHEN